MLFPGNQERLKMFAWRAAKKHKAYKKHNILSVD
jgi:hypothetical protein